MVAIAAFSTSSAVEAVSMLVATAYTPTVFNPPCRGAWIGVTQDLDFTFDGTTWHKFKACTAGTVIPVQAVGVRKSTGAAACSIGDCVFLY